MSCHRVPMRIALVAFATLVPALARAESAGVPECESYIAEKLLAPSTYRRVSASSTVIPDGKQGAYLSVLIAYDARNAFGVPIRERQSCSWPVRDGRPDLSLVVEHDEVVNGDFTGHVFTQADLVRRAEAAIAQADAALREADAIEAQAR